MKCDNSKGDINMETAWDIFSKTGDVKAYLLYCGLRRKQTMEVADFENREAEEAYYGSSELYKALDEEFKEEKKEKNKDDIEFI